MKRPLRSIIINNYDKFDDFQLKTAKQLKYKKSTIAVTRTKNFMAMKSIDFVNSQRSENNKLHKTVNISN